MVLALHGSTECLVVRCFREAGVVEPGFHHPWVWWITGFTPLATAGGVGHGVVHHVQHGTGAGAGINGPFGIKIGGTGGTVEISRSPSPAGEPNGRSSTDRSRRRAAATRPGTSVL